MNTPLEKIRAACIAANPQIAKEWVLCPECLGNGSDPNDENAPCECPGSVGRIEGRPIRQDDCAQIVTDKRELADRWVPGYLTDQPEEVIQWIYENKN